MPTKKVYKETSYYEKKLQNVMKRLGVEKYEYDWTRNTSYISFYYKGQWYRFDHSIEKANASGKMKLTCGTDTFAQIVIALEDLSRMVERGIYDLSVWVAGMKFLPKKNELPGCFRILAFTGSEYPDESTLKERYHMLVKQMHPDSGGNTEMLMNVKHAYDECLAYYKNKSCGN